ncbi:MAG TPA: hypothetical protein PK514_04610 [Spirochaetota bacterium]|nr:hypothetical protein [Spirochaetota bacterium]
MISSGTAFFLVFTALYLLESVTLCSSGAVIFYRGITGAVKYRFAKKLPEFGKGRLFIAPPFPPSASLFVTGSLPLLFSDRGFFSVKNGSEAGDLSFYNFDRVVRVGVSHNSVTVDGRAFCKTHSEHEAEWWKERLLRLARAGSADRESAAFSLLDETFDFKHVEEFIISAGRGTFILKAIAGWLFIYCFFIVPVVSWILSIAVSWNLLLGPFAVMVIAVVAAFIYSFKKVIPSQGVPWSKVFSMILYTPSLLRCMDIISKTSLAVFHPAAVARVLADDSVYRRLLSCYYREYTIAPVPQGDAECGEVFLWYRKHAAERVLAAARESGITRDELLAPPERKDEEIKTYCPLCHEQYVLESGTCSECGIELEPYGRS